MSDRTPRRRRPASDPGFPLIPLLIGAIVGGLAIGAGFSSLTNHGDSGRNTAIVASVEPTPVPQVTPVQLDSPTPEVQTPEPTASPTDTPTPEATITPIARVTPKQVRIASTPSPSVEVTASPDVIITAIPRAHTLSSPVATTTNTAAAPEYSISPAPRITPIAYRGKAEALVRSYLNALRNGDEATAYAALGATPTAPGAHIPEEAIVDRSLHIVDISSHGAPDQVTVEVDLTTDKGTYFGHYIVAPGPNGPIITSHDIIKP